MTLNQFRNIKLPVLAYWIPTNLSKNETKFSSSFWCDYNGEIRVQAWYQIYSPTWNEKKKQYQSQNGKVTVRIQDEYKYFGKDCTLKEVQDYIVENLLK